MNMFIFRVVVVSFFFCACYGQFHAISPPATPNLHNGLAERIGNFSIELLYHVTSNQEGSMNMIMSPVTVWSLLAVVAEGADGITLKEICKTLRISPSKRQESREDFKRIFQWLQVKTNTVELSRLNMIFVDQKKYPLRDFVDAAKNYDARIVEADFADKDAADTLNLAVSIVTHGQIPTIVNSEDLANSNMVMTSVLYFKGQWTVPFNATQTSRQPFYSSTGEMLGEVNMMFNRHNYPFANIKALQARVLEIPYGKENRLSMLIMLPNPGVSLKDMFFNFHNASLDLVFNELKISSERFSDEEVDCLLPRFKINTKLDITDTLKVMGIHDLFDESNSRLPSISRMPMYVTRVTHRAEIEVTEEGTTASAATTAEFSNRISIVRFEVNRPFCYLIVEKVTNSITFGGFYHMPTLF